MLKILFIKLFIFSFLICYAQQTILFLNLETKKTVSYTLPKKVLCITGSGKYKKLILTKITGDTLWFDDIKNKNQSYYSKYSNIKSIKFSNPWDGMTSVMTGGFGFLAVFSGFLTIQGITNDAVFFKAATPILIPICVLSSITTYYLYSLLTKYMSPTNWKIYVKEIQHFNKS